MEKNEEKQRQSTIEIAAGEHNGKYTFVCPLCGEQHLFLSEERIKNKLEEIAKNLEMIMDEIIRTAETVEEKEK